ncbi:MAG: CoA transferase [Hyphomicrobiaceae bacterium]|nr:CoA transferase [Hyphomicrobiaceae bacterium]
MSFDKPYEGIKVVDLSQGVAGPYCAYLLARHGAEVIKVEPLEGDWSRALGQRYGDHTAFSVAANLGKKSLAVDLKTEAGRRIVEQLIPSADVFLEGFRPGVIDRLGFGYDKLKAVNRGLIYLSVSGFGQVGPLREKPAMDPILQAFTGFMSENKGPDGVPHRTPTIVVDMSTALYSHQAVVAALYAKARGAPGRRINSSLMEAAANLQAIRMMSAVRDGPFRNVAGPGGTYLASDGGWIQIAAVKNHEFEGVCRVLDKEEWIRDPRFKTTTDRYTHAAWLGEQVAAIIKTRPAAEWRDKLTAAGLQNEIVQTYDDFVRHSHTEASGLISWTEHDGGGAPWATPNPAGTQRLESGAPDAIAPTLGQHTRQILAELGYSASDITALIEAKVVKA